MSKHVPPITGDNLKLLRMFANEGWHITSRRLAQWSGMLNYRARITELRQRYGVRIDADSVRIGGKRRTAFRVPIGHRMHAREVLRQGKKKGK